MKRERENNLKEACMRRLFLFFALFALLLARANYTYSEEKKSQSGTSRIDEKYLDRGSVERKLERKQQREELRRRSDLEGTQRDPWADSRRPDRTQETDNQDPRDGL
jgi:membrane protein involved in colicin uptake